MKITVCKDASYKSLRQTVELWKGAGQAVISEGVCECVCLFVQSLAMLPESI